MFHCMTCGQYYVKNSASLHGESGNCSEKSAKSAVFPKLDTKLVCIFCFTTIEGTMAHMAKHWRAHHTIDEAFIMGYPPKVYNLPSPKKLKQDTDSDGDDIAGN